MPIKVSRGPEFGSVIHLRHRRFTIAAVQACSELPKSLPAGRPPPTLRSGRNLAVFRGLCKDKNRTQAINYASKCCKLTSKHDDSGFMALAAISASLLSREVEKTSFFSRKLTFDMPYLDQILT